MSEEKNNQEPETTKNQTEDLLKNEENLLNKISELEQKNSEANDKLLRAFAELENVRRRSREEIEKSAKFAISNFASDLVLVAENFFLASDNAPKEEIEKSQEMKNYANAIEMTKKELIKVLEKNQVKRIFPLNEKFDHNFHEALAQVESEAEEGIVVQVIQAGYSIANRLIRPALVGVAKPKTN
jgi:molecular chaperone GrpE